MTIIEYEKIEIGLDYILKHFESKFPRTISTLVTENKQVLVHTKQEALEYFVQSNYVDCRISAFGVSEIDQEKPNLIFVDLDDRTALHESLALFHKEINGIPLVLSTGNGYAIIQPINIISLSNITFNKKSIQDVSKKLLLFTERYLSNSKCDMGNHPSLKSCMIRIPYSYNKKCLQGKSKQESKVTIYSEWNGKRAKINNLPFIRHLEKLENQLLQTSNRNFKNTGKIVYIEKLLQTKIIDGKQRINALVLCPYLINIKKLSLDESEKILVDYFKNSISRQLIIYQLKQSLKKGILPYSLKKMKVNDSELYQILCNSGVLEK